LDGNGQLVKDAARWFGLMPFSNVIPGVRHSLTEASTLVTSMSYARVIESIEQPWRGRGSVVSTHPRRPAAGNAAGRGAGTPCQASEDNGARFHVPVRWL